MKAIVTVLGADKPGIIANISQVLYKANANIIDLSQTVMSGEIFVMNMQVDLTNASMPFDKLGQELNDCGKNMGLDVRLQRQEIFDIMYRV